MTATAAASTRLCRRAASPSLIPEGIFTHFSVADDGEEGSYYTARQFRFFTNAISQLEQRGVTFRVHHCANSAGVLDYPEYQLDMVRPGIILYGLQPSPMMRRHYPPAPRDVREEHALPREAGGGGHQRQLRPLLHSGPPHACRHAADRLCRRLSPRPLLEGLGNDPRQEGSRAGPRVHGPASWWISPTSRGPGGG